MTHRVEMDNKNNQQEESESKNQTKTGQTKSWKDLSQASRDQRQMQVIEFKIKS